MGRSPSRSGSADTSHDAVVHRDTRCSGNTSSTGASPATGEPPGNWNAGYTTRPEPVVKREQPASLAHRLPTHRGPGTPEQLTHAVDVVHRAEVLDPRLGGIHRAVGRFPRQQLRVVGRGEAGAVRVAQQELGRQAIEELLLLRAQRGASRAGPSPPRRPATSAAPHLVVVNSVNHQCEVRFSVCQPCQPGRNSGSGSRSPGSGLPRAALRRAAVRRSVSRRAGHGDGMPAGRWHTCPARAPSSRVRLWRPTEPSAPRQGA